MGCYGDWALRSLQTLVSGLAREAHDLQTLLHELLLSLIQSCLYPLGCLIWLVGNQFRLWLLCIFRVTVLVWVASLGFKHLVIARCKILTRCWTCRGYILATCKSVSLIRSSHGRHTLSAAIDRESLTYFFFRKIECARLWEDSIVRWVTHKLSKLTSGRSICICLSRSHRYAPWSEIFSSRTITCF